MLHIFSFIIFLISLFVIYRISQSFAELKVKLLWSALVLFFPIIGTAAWYFMGPGNKELPF